MENKKDIKDYLPFYIGCEVFGTYSDASGSKGYLTGVTNGGTECEVQFFLEDGINVEEEPTWNDADDIKLILRRLYSMTEEELKEWVNQPSFTEHYCEETIKKISKSIYGLYNFLGCYGSPNSIPWLLSKGFDLFNLIPNGLAIDKSSLVKQ